MLDCGESVDMSSKRLCICRDSVKTCDDDAPLPIGRFAFPTEDMAIDKSLPMFCRPLCRVLTAGIGLDIWSSLLFQKLKIFSSSGGKISALAVENVADTVPGQYFNGIC